MEDAVEDTSDDGVEEFESVEVADEVEGLVGFACPVLELDEDSGVSVFGVFVATEDVDDVDNAEVEDGVESAEVAVSVEVVESVGVVEAEPSESEAVEFGVDAEVDTGEEAVSVEAVVAAVEVDVLILDPLPDDEIAEDEVGINAEVGMEFLEPEDDEGMGPCEDPEPVALACVDIELENLFGIFEVGRNASELGPVLRDWDDPVTTNLVAGVTGEVPSGSCLSVE